MECADAVCPLTLRRHRRTGALPPAVVLLTGRGGEGEDCGRCVLPGATRWLSARCYFFKLEAAICGDTKRRQLAGAIYDRKGRSTLGKSRAPQSSMAVFAQEGTHWPTGKIIFDLSAGRTVGVSPSGSFPGGGAGSGVPRFFDDGVECGGPDLPNFLGFPL